MNTRYEITCGLTWDASGNRINAHRSNKALIHLRKYLVENFDGYTLTKTDGAFKNKAGEIVEDKGICIVIYTTESVPSTKVFPELLDLLNEIFTQECVLVSIQPCDASLHYAPVIEYSKTPHPGREYEKRA